VGVLLTAGAARFGVEVVDLVGAEVEELDEEEDAVGGEVAGVADLFDFGVGQGGFALLSVERGEAERERAEGDEEQCAILAISGGGHEGLPQGAKARHLAEFREAKAKALAYLEASALL